MAAPSNNPRKTNVIYIWAIPEGGVRERDGTDGEMEILFHKLPNELSDHIRKLFSVEKLLSLNEIYLQLGQFPECIFAEADGRTCRQRILEYVVSPRVHYVLCIGNVKDAS